MTANLSRVGFWFVPLLAFYAIPEAAFIEGWRQVLTPRPPLRTLPALAGAFLAGDTANYFGAGVAGEPLRGYLVRDRFGAGAAFASVNLRKHAELLALVVFLVLGIALCLALFSLPAALVAAGVGGVLAIGAGLVLMTWALRRGTYEPILRRFSGWRLIAVRLKPYHERAAEVDERIRIFYGASPLRFAASTGWAFLGWAGNCVETWLILRLLGTGAGWVEAVVVETLTTALITMVLFVPGRLGTAEAIRTGVLVALGLPAAAGIAYALVRRAREAVWVLPGAVYIVRRHAGGWLRGSAERKTPLVEPAAPH